ncbi:EFM3 CHATD-lysine N-methyltransferase protein [Rutstroemia sp. NJR-2017a WRK4]|nr:EFM3 CHATD-lysine N-methyltransferase protein [Rutstroemia sp. NJR-2017a WRK4]
MTKELAQQAQEQLDRFCRQYLQLLRVLDYPNDEYLRNGEFQETIYERLFEENALQYPPPQRYQFRVLKELTKRIENSIQDWDEEAVSDNLMDQLSVMMSTPLPSEFTAAQQSSYVTYTLSSLSSSSTVSLESREIPPTITLLESASLLAGAGTTGLRTWDAALHLSTYLSLHPTLVTDKTILELGCGTGLVSILCAKYLHATHVLATDGSPETLIALNTSLYLNGLTSTPSTPSSSQETTNHPKISTRELIWGHLLSSGEFDSFSSFLSSKSSNPNSASSAGDLDLVLAADVLYSPEIIPPFIATLEDLFDLYPAVEVLIASAIRNRATYLIFTEMCERKKWAVERVEGFEVLERSEQKGPWYGEMGEEIEITWVRRRK